MPRLLIIAGVLLILTGLAWPWLTKLGLGRLPGDIVIERDGAAVGPIVDNDSVILFNFRGDRAFVLTNGGNWGYPMPVEPMIDAEAEFADEMADEPYIDEP